MYSPEPYYKRKSKIRFIHIFLVVILPLLGTGIYFIFPRTYYYFVKNPLTRIDGRAEKIAGLVLDKKNSRKRIYLEIADSRKILRVVESDAPTSAQIQYYQGLMHLYELQLRLQLDPRSLLGLAGRLELPPERTGDDFKSRHSVVHLSRLLSRRMRKAQAMAPDFKDMSSVKLGIIYGDLINTARTDKRLLVLFESINESELNPSLLPMYDWMGLVLYAFNGKQKKLEALAARVRKAEGKYPRLSISQAELELALCFGLFHARSFLPALRLARRIQNDDNALQLIKIEARRMEGEIFLIQRGARIAVVHFQKALAMAGGDDEFIKYRIKEITRKVK